jgi:glutathione synthase/RimK-type ligase-like ATP-grasp enzyme
VAKLGLSVAGVDIIQTTNKSLYVIEVNPEPDITLDY